MYRELFKELDGKAMVAAAQLIATQKQHTIDQPWLEHRKKSYQYQARQHIGSHKVTRTTAGTTAEECVYLESGMTATQDIVSADFAHLEKRPLIPETVTQKKTDTECYSSKTKS